MNDLTLSASRHGVQVAAVDPTQAALAAATAPGADAAATAAAAAADPNQLAALGVWLPRESGLEDSSPHRNGSNEPDLFVLCEVFVFVAADMFLFLMSNYSKLGQIYSNLVL